MRRIYPTFPGGLPGAGLLLLRAAVGARLIAYSIGSVTESHVLAAGMWAPCLLALVMGLSFLAGFLTRWIGASFALAAAAIELLEPAWARSIASQLSVDAILIAVAICFLGPGVFSLDALFFGPRKIIIPRGDNL